METIFKILMRVIPLYHFIKLFSKYSYADIFSINNRCYLEDSLLKAFSKINVRNKTKNKYIGFRRIKEDKILVTYTDDKDDFKDDGIKLYVRVKELNRKKLLELIDKSNDYTEKVFFIKLYFGFERKIRRYKTRKYIFNKFHKICIEYLLSKKTTNK